MSEQILSGRYHLQGAIGGKSDLFYALDELLQRKVVVKCLSGVVTEERRQHWEQEIAKAAGMQNPNLLAVYDLVAEADCMYLIAEDLEGVPLAQFVRERAPLSPMEAIDVLHQLTSAVVEAEKQGMTDHSMDSHEVWMTGDGRVKLLGYGPLLSDDQRALLSRRPVSVAGAVLYEMLTGKTYSVLLPIQRILLDLQASLSRATVEHQWLPMRLEQIVVRCLDAMEQGAYHSVGELAKDVRIVHQALLPQVGQGVSVPHPLMAKQEETTGASVVVEGQAAAQPTVPISVTARKEQFVKKIEELHTPKRNAKMYVVAVVVLLLVAGGSWWWLNQEPSVATISGDMSQTASGKEIQMPDLLNKSEDQAMQLLVDRGYPKDRIQWVRKPTDDPASKGKVIRQSPEPNTTFVLGQEAMVLTVSSGVAEQAQPPINPPEAVVDKKPQPTVVAGQVPDLRGLSQPQVEQLLLKLGYRYNFMIDQGDTKPGTVFKQTPAPGTKAEPGKQVVTFYISQ